MVTTTRQNRRPAPSPSDMACKRLSVMLVGGAAEQRSSLQQRLARHCGLVEAADSLEKASQLASRCHFDFLVVEPHDNSDWSLDWVPQLKGSSNIILVAHRPDTERAIAALRAGISDIVNRPADTADLIDAFRRQLPIDDAVSASPLTRVGTSSRHQLVGESPSIRQVKTLIDRIATSTATVLIQGETGTGKELVARLLHANSGRHGNFVPVNCGAIAPELLESELFGHTRGAFTNAHQGREGLFVSARAGTVFLDEISEMPFDMEVKLLRAIEESAIRPVGADREVPIDCRIVASTQHELTDRIKMGRFREDLYYRLNVIHIDLPSLRSRPEDIPLLVDHFIKSLSIELAVPPVKLSARNMDKLQSYSWPGNVRELKNVLERTLLLGIDPEQSLQQLNGTRAESNASYSLDWTLEQVKQHHMAQVLEASGGNKSEAARRLDISRKTLERKLPTDPGRS
ncbi:MAG: sigma-54 dependent transcriptional regulator [Gammaproteobacteria bacterium]|nr:sigma-54 dependent transcriptional regulator [Gammaproteobacteria bacterium]